MPNNSSYKIFRSKYFIQYASKIMNFMIRNTYKYSTIF